MILQIIVIALGSIVGYELIKTWLQSSLQQQVQEKTELIATPIMFVILLLLAIALLRR